jgi:NAD(P)H-dependent FMN reductase
MIWSTAGYHGTIAGVTKNALDFLEFLSESESPYLHQRVVGLIATAAGELAAVNAINAMVHVVHALRGTVAPLFVPVPRARESVDSTGRVVDQKVAGRLDMLGKLVVETTKMMQTIKV